MNYKAGDDVVCIDSLPHNDDTPNSLLRGKTYRVLATAECVHGTTVNVGVDCEGERICLLCGEIVHEFRASRFIKLDGETGQQTELNEATA